MKILEQPKPFSQIIDCRHCGAKLEIGQEDIGYGDFGAGYGDDHDWRYYVKCPCCELCNFPDVPRHIQVKIPRD